MFDNQDERAGEGEKGTDLFILNSTINLSPFPPPFASRGGTESKMLYTGINSSRSEGIFCFLLTGLIVYSIFITPL